MRKRGVRTGCENTECLFRLLSGLVLLRPPRYPPALAPILPFFSFNSSARLQKSQFLHPSLCKCLRKLERSVYSSLRTSLAVQAHDQLIQMSFQLYVTAAPPIWPFYRPSYDRNSWQNCFMVIKKKKWVHVYFSNDLQNRGSKITFNHCTVHWRCQLTPGAVRMQELSFSTSFISVKKGSWTCSWFKSTRLCHCFLSWRPSEGQQSMFLLYGRGCQRSRRSSVLTLQNFNG